MRYGNDRFRFARYAIDCAYCGQLNVSPEEWDAHAATHPRPTKLAALLRDAVFSAWDATPNYPVMPFPLDVYEDAAERLIAAGIGDKADLARRITERVMALDPKSPFVRWDVVLHIVDEETAR